MAQKFEELGNSEIQEYTTKKKANDKDARNIVYHFYGNLGHDLYIKNLLNYYLTIPAGPRRV